LRTLTILSSEGARSAWNFNLRGDCVLAESGTTFFDFALTDEGIGVLLCKEYSECIAKSSDLSSRAIAFSNPLLHVEVTVWDHLEAKFIPIF